MVVRERLSKCCQQDFDLIKIQTKKNKLNEMMKKKKKTTEWTSKQDDDERKKKLMALKIISINLHTHHILQD